MNHDRLEQLFVVYSVKRRSKFPEILLRLSLWIKVIMRVIINSYTGSTFLCVLCNKKSNLLKVWLEWHCYHSDLISHGQTNRQGTPGPIDYHIYKYVLTPPITCRQQPPILHWMNNLLIQIFTSQKSTISSLYKNYTPIKVISAD